jgi:hypothetical protein
MPRFDRTLVAPSRAELDRTLQEAAVAANKGCRARLVRWTPETVEALAKESASEGFRQFNGEGKHTRSWADRLSAVAVAWWTDSLSRRHYRIAAGRPACPSSEAVTIS